MPPGTKPNETPVGPARQSGIGCGMRWLGNGIAAFAIVAAFATAGLFCLISEPYVADPPSYAGDRVVVVERNVFLAGNRSRLPRAARAGARLRDRRVTVPMTATAP